MNKLQGFIRQGIKSLKREKFFALVNILGLSLGMFCFIITSLYVTDELTHDKWHTHADHIYMPTVKMGHGDRSISMLPPFAIGDAWKDQIPGVLNSVTLTEGEKLNFTIKGQPFTTEVHFSEPELFEIFDFRLILGQQEVLADPSSLIISESFAKKHFASLNPLGEVVVVEDYGEFTVAAVLEDVPSNSHIQLDLILPIDFNHQRFKGLKNNWKMGNGLHYLLLEENYDIDRLKKETAEMIKINDPKASFTSYDFDKFSELYLKGNTWRSRGNVFGGNEQYIYIFSFIGILMLIVATFNYVNLTTARAFSRSKDLAIRRIIGANKVRLISLQLGETVFIAIIALVIAFIAVEGLLPTINSLIKKEMSLQLFANPQFLAIPALMLVTIIISSGLYPAILGSRFNMVAMLKGKSPNSTTSYFRKGLIVVQFVICTGLFSSALIIRNQAQFLIDFDLGYHKENILTTDMRVEGIFEKYEEVLAELERNPQIIQATGAPLPLAGGAMIFDTGEEGNTNRTFVSYGAADKGFIKMYGIELLAGSAFEELKESELTHAVMINKKALELWGFELNSVIGQNIPGSKFKVVAVTQDFHFRAPTTEISPLLITYDPAQISALSVKFREGEREQVVAYMSQVWENLGLSKEFQYDLVDGYYDDSYTRQETLIGIFDMLTAMLILVAFLGLFALATFESQLKEKELSIRKVLGANYLTLIKALNSKFLMLIIMAIVIAIPVTQELIKEWLENYPYRIASTTPYFMISGIIVLLLALGLLTWQGMRRATQNPVEVLRND